MPGICGFIDATGGDPGTYLAGMVESLCHFTWHSTAVATIGGAGLGQAIVNAPGEHRAPAFGRCRDLTVAFDGELYEPPALRPGESPADGIARRLVEHGHTAFQSAPGCFSCAVWDSSLRRLQLISDPFGMRPLYWAQVREGLIFASELKALLAVPSLSRRLSSAGLGQFFALGQYLGATTAFDAISVLPAGTVLTFGADGRVQLDRYSSVTPLPAAPTTRAAALDAVADAFGASVERQTAATSGLGLSLSGGLDARTILAVVPKEIPLTSVSLGIPGSIDHRSAAALAAIAGRPHHALMLDQSFLGRFEEHLRRMVHLTDGQYLDQGIVLTTLPTYRELGVSTLLRGHAGELLHMRKAYAFSLDESALAAADQATLEAWLWRHLSAYMIEAVDGPLFAAGSGSDLLEQARESLRSSLAATSNDADPPVQRVWQLFVNERLRRETALSLQMFRSFVEVRMPYLDPALVSLLLALPPELKLGDTLQSHILQRSNPAFLRVVNANTGAPMGAGALETRVAQFRMKVYAKLGVPGYQPYERLGLWLARDLKPLVHRLLLSDRFLSRGVFVPEAVSRIVAQHEARTHNHTFLIMAMLVFEIGQEDLFDARGRSRDVA